MLTPVEQEARKSGYVRCPNNPSRWYPGGPGIPQLKHWFQEVHIERAVGRLHDREHEFIRLYEYQNGRGYVHKMSFASWTDFLSYVSQHGKLSEPGQPAFSNAWD